MKEFKRKKRSCRYGLKNYIGKGREKDIYERNADKYGKKEKENS